MAFAENTVAWCVALGLFGLIAASIVFRKPLRAWWWRREAREAVQSFKRHREVLEAKFFDLAAASGKARLRATK